MAGSEPAAFPSWLRPNNGWEGDGRSRNLLIQSQPLCHLSYLPAIFPKSIPIFVTVLQYVLFRLRGVHRVNQPAIRLANSQILADRGERLRYPGHLLGYALSQETVTVSHKILRRQFAHDRTPLRNAHPLPAAQPIRYGDLGE